MRHRVEAGVRCFQQQAGALALVERRQLLRLRHKQQEQQREQQDHPSFQGVVARFVFGVGDVVGLHRRLLDRSMGSIEVRDVT
jgi:hypothetical protein